MAVEVDTRLCFVFGLQQLTDRTDKWAVAVVTVVVVVVAVVHTLHSHTHTDQFTLNYIRTVHIVFMK